MSKHTLGAIRLAVLVCAAALLVAPASALADGGGPSVTLGPIKVQHGWSVTIFAGCSSRGSSTTIDYTKGTTGQFLSHDYSGPRSTCTLSKSLASGKISLSWPGAAAIDVKLGHAGAMTHPAAPAGCRQKRADQRSLSASGHISISIHAGAFGKVSMRRANGSAALTTGLNCKATNNSIFLSASFGTNYSMFVNGTQPRRGQRIVTVSDSTGDQPATGVTGFFDAQLLGGKSLFSAASNLTKATLHGSGPVGGSLKFTAQAACPGERNSRPGTLSGELVIHDPVLGTLHFSGAQAAGVYVAKGNGTAPTCGNTGTTIAPTPSFFDDCDTAGLCSVSLGTNAVTFYDATSPGSATVTGETWSFGDGTSAPGTLDGSVQHTYAAAGTYTVTLTVTVADGKQYSSTGTVYIGS